MQSNTLALPLNLGSSLELQIICYVPVFTHPSSFHYGRNRYPWWTSTMRYCPGRADIWLYIQRCNFSICFETAIFRVCICVCNLWHWYLAVEQSQGYYPRIRGDNRYTLASLTMLPGAIMPIQISQGSSDSGRVHICYDLGIRPANVSNVLPILTKVLPKILAAPEGQEYSPSCLLSVRAVSLALQLMVLSHDSRCDLGCSLYDAFA